MVQHGPILITRAHVDVKPLRAELPTSTSRRCYGIRCTRDTRSNVQSVSVSRRQPRPHGGLSHGQQHRETDQEANKRRHCNFLLFGTQAGQRAHHTVLARAGTQPVAGPHARGWPHWSRPDAPPRTGGWAGSVRFNPLLRGATSATRDAELGHPYGRFREARGGLHRGHPLTSSSVPAGLSAWIRIGGSTPQERRATGHPSLGSTGIAPTTLRHRRVTGSSSCHGAFPAWVGLRRISRERPRPAVWRSGKVRLQVPDDLLVTLPGRPPVGLSGDGTDGSGDQVLGWSGHLTGQISPVPGRLGRTW
jgi:hypothetical protein